MAPKGIFGSEGSRSSRRVDKIDGEHAEGLLSVEGLWAVVATMASMATIGFGWWRRWVAGVVDTKGADVEVPLCPQW